MNSSIINIISDLNLYYSLILNMINKKSEISKNTSTLIYSMLIKDLSTIIREIEKYNNFNKDDINFNLKYQEEIKQIRNQLKLCEYKANINKTNKQIDEILHDIKKEYKRVYISIFTQEGKLTGSDLYLYHNLARIGRVFNIGKHISDISEELSYNILTLKEQYNTLYKCDVNSYIMFNDTIENTTGIFSDYRFDYLCSKNNLNIYEMYRLLTTVTEVSAVFMLIELINKEMLEKNICSVYSFTKMLCIKYISIVKNLEDLGFYNILKDQLYLSINNLRNTHHYKEIFEEISKANLNNEYLINSWCKQIGIKDIKELYKIKDFIINDMKSIQESIREKIKY